MSDGGREFLMSMNKLGMTLLMVTGALAIAASVFAQGDTDTGHGRADFSQEVW
jgi:hypothetical protein